MMTIELQNVLWRTKKVGNLWMEHVHEQ